MTDSSAGVAGTERAVSRLATLVWLLAGSGCAVLLLILCTDRGLGRIGEVLGVEMVEMSEFRRMQYAQVLVLLGAVGAFLVSVGVWEQRRRISIGSAALWSNRIVGWLFLAAATVICGWHALGNVADGYDEIIYLTNARNLLGDPVYYRLGRPPLMPVLCVFLAENATVVNALGMIGLLAVTAGLARERTGSAALGILAAVICLANDGFRSYLGEARPMLLPAACLLFSVAAYIKERPFLCGLAAAIAVLGRWNYASVFILFAVLCWRRSGWRAVLSYLIPGAVLGGPYGIWCWIRFGSPLAGPMSLLHQNTGADILLPTAMDRWTDYAIDFYWLTPVPCLALLWWIVTLVRRQGWDTGDLRFVGALAALAYILPLHFLSLPLLRYGLPLLPIAAIALVDVAARTPRARVLWRLAILATVALQLWPLFSAGYSVLLERSCHPTMAELRPLLREHAAPGEQVYSRVASGLATYYLRQRVVGVGVPGDAHAAAVADCFADATMDFHNAWIFSGDDQAGEVEPDQVPPGSLLITLEPSGQILGSTGVFFLERTR